MCRKEMDEFLGLFSIIPFTPKDPNDLSTKPYVQLLKEAQKGLLSNEPYLYIFKDCPEETKKKIIKKWQQVYKDTIKRHENGIYSSKDYF